MKKWLWLSCDSIFTFNAPNEDAAFEFAIAKRIEFTGESRETAINHFDKNDQLIDITNVEHLVRAGSND